MRKVDENQAQNYIRKHRNYKRWIAFALCVALLTGSTTLYMLNKPATAMTEEGAENVGLVLETADSAYEESLIQETMENKDSSASEGSSSGGEDASSAGESGDEEATEEAAESDVASDSENLEETKNSESLEETKDSESLEKTENSESLGKAGNISEDDNKKVKKSEDGENTSEEKKENPLTTEEKLAKLDVPESVDVAEYVTETIIERKLEDGSWERISEDDILPGDTLKITFKYDLPNNAVVSDDIHLDIPEKYGTAVAAESSLDGGKGEYEITEDNQIKIQYSDDIKQEIIESVTEEDTDLQASIAETRFFLPGFIAKLDGLFSFTAYAAEDNSTTGSVTTITRVADTKATVEDKTKRYTVDSVSAKKAAQYQDDWTDIEDGATVEPTDKIKFNLHFTIPEGTLGTATEDDRQIEYNLNDHGIVLLEAVNNAPVNIYKTTTQVGTYSINKDGVATITYFKNYAAQNSGAPIDGYLEFTSSVISTGKSDGSEHKYVFSEDVTFDIRIETEKIYGFSIEKSQDETEIKNGKISYTVVLRSPNGTNGESVHVEDLLSVYDGNYVDESKENQSYEQLIDLSKVDITVSGTDGTEVITGNGNSFSGVFPEMKAGDEYKITYTLDIPDEIRNNLTLIRNKATGYTDEEHKKYAETKYSFDPVPLVDKSSSTDKNNRQITWTITLNSKKVNLNGYTLKDVFLGADGVVDNGTEFTGEVDVTPAINGSSKVRLPYTFTTDDYNTYTFTFKKGYNLSDATDSGHIANYVSISKETDIHDDTEYASVGGSGAVVEKVAKSMTGDGNDSSDHKLVTMEWNVAVKAPIYKNEGAGNSEYWIYYDEIAAPGFITDIELDKLQADLRSSFDSNCEVQAENSSAVSIDGNIVGYRYFTIKFYKDLTGKDDLTFSYETKGDVGNGNSEVDLKNSSWVFNKNFKSEDSKKYYPLVEKYDGISNSTSTSTYDYSDSKLFSSGILTWKFRVAIPEGYSEKLLIKETLPNETTFVGSEFTYSDRTYDGLSVSNSIDFSNASSFEFGENGKNCTVSYCGREYNAKVENDGNLEIELPSDTVSALAGSSIFFRVRVKINDSYTWPEDSYVNPSKFTNELSVCNKNGDELGSSSQTQNITKTTKNVSKTGALGENNSVSYKIEINPEAADLLRDSDELTLEDVLTAYRYDYGRNVPFKVTLIPGSLKVYEVKENGSDTVFGTDGREYRAELLDESKYQYSMTSENHYQYNTYYDLEYLIMTIPDRKHLIIDYSYIVSGEEIFGQKVKLSNKATLKGISEGNTSKTGELELSIQDSMSETAVRGIRLYKVDSENMGLFLNGATFKLYRYDPDTEEYEDINKSFTTETDKITGEVGKAVITVDKYNTAYMLVETNPPKGYAPSNKPYYFMVKNTSSTVMPLYTQAVKPADFNAKGGVELTPSQDVYIKNISNHTKVTINKLWNDDGNSNARPQSINVKLSRKLGNDATGDSAETYTVKFRVLNQNGDYIGTVVKAGVVRGTTIGFTLECVTASGTPIVTKNGAVLPPISEVSIIGGKNKLGYSFKVDSEIAIDIKFTHWETYLINNSYDDFTAWSEAMTVDEPKTDKNEKPKIDKDDFPINITLTGASGWTWTSDKLDRYYYPGQQTEEGEDIRYEWLYYFTEYTSVYYDAEFSSNNSTGINYGTITLTNTRNSVEGYSLPATGGNGDKPFKAAGFGFMSFAMISSGVVVYRRRRKRKVLDA